MANLTIENGSNKNEVFEEVHDYLGSLVLKTVDSDDQRPWGGYYVIDESQTSEFIDYYFPGLSNDEIERGGKLSPKILIVEPGKRLSWQYHNRREELWKVIAGPVGVITSENDEQGPVKSLEVGDIVQFGVGVRHRLVGLDGWGVVAEIWQHTDPDNHSEESDIVRVEDDFGR